VTLRVVVDRDPESPTGWTATWLEEQFGRVERVTSTCVDPGALVDAIDELQAERYVAAQASR
jgi:hypothetical protein